MNTTAAANKIVFTLTHRELPECDGAREDIADNLAALGFRVRVNRYGTGNGKHFWFGRCGVESIEFSL